MIPIEMGSHSKNGDASGFDALGLMDALAASVSALGYEEPTPVQREAIPLLIAKRDLLAQAATGTGKTAAFALPMLQRLAQDKTKHTGGLVLVPTRSMAARRSRSRSAPSSAASASSSPRRGARSITSSAVP